MARKVNSTRKPGDKHCGAAKASGGNCKNASGYKTNHVGTGRCFIHGGTSPGGEIAAAKEQVELDTRQWAMVTPIHADPGEALLHALHSAVALTSAHRMALSEGISDDADEKTMNRRRKTYEDALDRQRLYAESCLRMGIAARQVQLVERAGDQIYALVIGVLDDLGIDQKKAQEVVTRRLAQLGSGTVIETTAEEAPDE